MACSEQRRRKVPYSSSGVAQTNVGHYGQLSLTLRPSLHDVRYEAHESDVRHYLFQIACLSTGHALNWQLSYSDGSSLSFTNYFQLEAD